jgi:hypothetical protein
LEIKRKIGDQQGLAYTLNNIAVIHKNKGEYEEALSHALGAYRILERLKSPELRPLEMLSFIKEKLRSEAYERLVKKVERYA